MCFNATASLMAATVLIPAGVYTLDVVQHGDRRFLILAAFPLLFGIQQAFEGLLWLSLGDPLIGLLGAPPGSLGLSAALAFLFFAYALWPALVPIAAWCIEAQRIRRRAFAAASLAGAALGLALYLPLLYNEGWLTIRLINGSILYDPRLIFDPFVSREVIRGIYALIVTVPLVTSSERLVRRFGILVIGSVLISASVFDYAFVSIWCFFAALLSAWLAVQLPLRMAGTRPGHAPLHGNLFHHG